MRSQGVNVELEPSPRQSSSSNGDPGDEPEDPAYDLGDNDEDSEEESSTDDERD